MMAGERAAASGLLANLRLDSGHVLGAAAFLAPPLALFAPLALAPLVGLTAVAALIIGRIRGESWPAVPAAFAGVVALGLLWALVTLSWTPEPRISAGKLGELALLLAACLIVIGIGRELDRSRQARVERWLVAGFGLAVALLFIELVAGYPIRHIERAQWVAEPYLWQSFDRGSAVLAMLVWPAARALWRRSALGAVVLWLATAALVFSLSSATAKFALGAGALAFVIARAAPRGIAAALGAILAVVILAMPLLAARIPPVEILQQHWPFNTVSLAHGKNSAQSALHRLLIWQFTAGHIAEKPLLGWGFNASRWLPGGDTVVIRNQTALPLHPHDMPLQLWAELGLPGALLGAAAAVLALGGVRRTRDPRAAATGVALAAAAAAVAGLGFGAWQSWWLCALALAAALYLATSRGDSVHT